MKIIWKYLQITKITPHNEIHTTNVKLPSKPIIITHDDSHAQHNRAHFSLNFPNFSPDFPEFSGRRLRRLVATVLNRYPVCPNTIKWLADGIFLAKAPPLALGDPFTASEQGLRGVGRESLMWGPGGCSSPTLRPKEKRVVLWDCLRRDFRR